MGRRVLIVLTNHSELGDTGKKTGWYLPEVAHPYHVFKEAGYACDFLSPKGGHTPVDPGSVDAFKGDAICDAFLADKAVMKQVEHTKKCAEVSSSDYDVVFYAGGHGPMFDLVKATDIAALATKVYEKGGILGAVCHGTVGLVPVKLSGGESVLKGSTVTCFTNSEEDAVQLSSVMPFMLETRLTDLGASFKAAGNFEGNVVVSGRIITGQNPASASGTAETIVKALSGATGGQKSS